MYRDYRWLAQDAFEEGKHPRDHGKFATSEKLSGQLDKVQSRAGLVGGETIHNMPLNILHSGVDKKHENNNPKIEAIRKAIRSGAKLPPVILRTDTGDPNRSLPKGHFDIDDGFHRYHAHRLEGKKTIKAVFAKDVLPQSV